MTVVGRGWWIVPIAAAWVAAAGAAIADNGAVAYAYPLESIEIDGELGDWPDRIPRYPIDRMTGRGPSHPGDVSASYRVGHDATRRFLYVAVEVQDDSHVVDDGEDASWDSQDSHLLYLDIDHTPQGSPPILFQSGERYRELTLADRRDAPTRQPKSWDDVTLAIARHDSTTVYEWRVAMGEGFRPGRSIGIDHLLFDADADEDGGTFVHWGPSLGKSSNAGRLGDLVLLDADTELGTARGHLVWDGPVPARVPARVRITSADHPEQWIQAEVDQGGRYRVQLPVGRYELRLPHTISEPFSGWGDHQVRIDTNARLDFELGGGRITDVETLRVATYRRPDFLLRETPVLPGFDPDDPSHVAELSHVTESFRRFYDVPGASLAVVKDGAIVYHETFGTQNVLTGEPVTPETLFEAASITKSVFAFAFMRLVERGLIDLDRPLHEYLPFENLEGDPRYKTITARLALSHQTGLSNWPLGGPGGFRNGGTAELQFDPGTGYSYSGTMTNYLGRVAEKVTGKPIEQIVQEETLDVMGMERTYFSEHPVVVASTSLGHFHTLPTFGGFPDEASMASSMHTDSAELGRFMIGLMEGRGLKEATRQEMWRRHVEVPVDEDDVDARPTQAALGFFWLEYGAGETVGHGGNNGDFQCIMRMIPELGVGYALMTNNNVGHKLQLALDDYLLDGR